VARGRAAGVPALLPAAVLALLTVGLAIAGWAGVDPLARGTAGPPAVRPLVVRQAELWFATAPAPGVWAELKIILDNPMTLEAERTTLRLPAALLDDFVLRDTEPPLLWPPVREPDGRYAFVFPAPLDRSLNWYRVFLAARKGAPRPLSVALAVDGSRTAAQTRVDVPAVAARTRYVDRTADPFRVVPEVFVGWLPTRSSFLLPLLTLAAAVLATTAAGGCLAAFWFLKR
jgi:hypothetical protein